MATQDQRNADARIMLRQLAHEYDLLAKRADDRLRESAD
jgi:hypothetical protein